MTLIKASMVEIRRLIAIARDMDLTLSVAIPSSVLRIVIESEHQAWLSLRSKLAAEPHVDQEISGPPHVIT